MSETPNLTPEEVQRITDKFGQRMQDKETECSITRITKLLIDNAQTLSNKSEPEDEVTVKIGCLRKLAMHMFMDGVKSGKELIMAVQEAVDDIENPKEKA